MADGMEERWQAENRYMDKRSQKERDYGKLVDERDERW